MSVGEYCNRDVVVIEQTESVRQAVALMREYHVGSVVVIDKAGGSAKPMGILTDRDIVIEILAENVDMDDVNVGDVMSADLVTVDESVPLMDAVQTMRSHGIRRLPVVESDGVLAGVLAVDDIIELVAEQMDALVSLISLEQVHEEELRS